MADPDLIPIADARVAYWPASATDPRLQLRVIRGPLDEAQLAFLAKRGGSHALADITGTGDAQALFFALGRTHGFVSAAEVRAEFGKIDCALGDCHRRLTKIVTA